MSFDTNGTDSGIVAPDDVESQVFDWAFSSGCVRPR